MANDKVILLVEDNPDDVELTLRALRQGNVLNEVKVAEDGEKALYYLFEEKIVPSVILLDLKMPKIDGLEVLKRIRSDARMKLMPVVILTSSKEERDLVNSYKLGANSYVQKPVNFVEFVVAVQRLGLYWLLVNEPPPIERTGRMR